MKPIVDYLKSIEKIDWQFYIVCFLFFTSFLYTLPKGGHMSDLNLFIYWSDYIYKYGLSNVYNSGSDYMPLYYYFLWVYGKINGTEELINYNYKYLKVYSLIFLIINSILIFKIIKAYRGKENSIFLSMFYLLNAAVLFNVITWGQVDEIETFFIFGSVIAGFRKKFGLSLVLLVLAINFKLQAIILIPIFLLVNLNQRETLNLRQISIGIFSALLVQIIILSPFIQNNSLIKIYQVITNSFNKYPALSMNAYNFWYLFFRNQSYYMEDTLTFCGVTYKTWGLLLFFTFSGITLFPFLKSILNKIHFTLGQILLTSGLIVLIFFYFNSEMHERYSHPALIFLILYGLIEKRTLIPLMTCVAYLSNNYKVLQYSIDDIHSKFFIGDVFFISMLYFIVIIIGILWLYHIDIEKKIFLFLNDNLCRNNSISLSNQKNK